MNRYPLWKYITVAVALVLGFIYTLPNFYGELPAVQVSSAKATLKTDDATRARVEAFRNLGTAVGRMAAEWADFFERFDMEKYGSEGAPLHDPTVIAYLINPGLFAGRHINVEI